MSITHDSIVDGEGLRTVIFTAGCPHACFGCHNPSTWLSDRGKEVSIQQLVEAIREYPMNDVTLSGGEPFQQADQLGLLAEEIKAMGKNLWIYTGYTYEQLLKRNQKSELQLLMQADVIVDGPFVMSKKDERLAFRGSSNQRIIKITAKHGEEIEKQLYQLN